MNTVALEKERPLEKERQAYNKKRRFLGDLDSGDSNFYHVISRVVDRRFVLGEDEKEYFRKLLFRLAKFAGVEVVAWCFLSNHFHLLIEVPNKDKALKGWTDEKFLKQLEMIRSETSTRMLLRQIKMWQGNGNRDGVAKVTRGVRARMCDLSVFVKELKNKFSFWFNKRHGRKGTLWEERFKSVLLEDGEAVRFCAAYIDLNPVRAGVCKDPEEYRWCSYAAAVAGCRVSRKGLARVWRRQRWTSALADEYRLLLFGRGEVIAGGEGVDGGQVKSKAGFSRERIESEQAKGGRLPMWQVLRSRVRYFSDGAVLGSRAFVDGVFERERERGRFGTKRKTGARKLRDKGDWSGVMSLRDLGLPNPLK